MQSAQVSNSMFLGKLVAMERVLSLLADVKGK